MQERVTTDGKAGQSCYDYIVYRADPGSWARADPTLQATAHLTLWGLALPSRPEE
jgi:hypothetical protein